MNIDAALFLDSEKDQPLVKVSESRQACFLVVGGYFILAPTHIKGKISIFLELILSCL